MTKSAWIDFDKLYAVEKSVIDMKNFLSDNDLTDKNKDAIMQLSAQEISELLNLYADVNNRKIDYKNKKVYLDNNIILSYDCYETYIKRMHKAYSEIGNIQKRVLGENKYNQMVYAL